MGGLVTLTDSQVGKQPEGLKDGYWLQNKCQQLPELIWSNSEVPVVAVVAQLVCAMRRERDGPAVLDIDRVRSTRHPSLSSLYTPSLFPRPPITLSCPAALLFTELVTLSTYCTFTIFPFVIGRTCRHHFFFSSYLTLLPLLTICSLTHPGWSNNAQQPQQPTNAPLLMSRH